MRASVKTNLSLFEFFQIMMIRPYFGAQVWINVPQTTRPDCDDVIYQWGWQFSDSIGREDFAQAINEAERMIENVLGYPTAPRYIEGEPIQYPQSYDKRAITGFWQADAHLKAIQTKKRHIQAIGVEQLTAINAAAAVVYSDVDNDGIGDTFTITQAVAAGVTADEIALFFTSTDRLGNPQDEYEIRPIRVTISAGTATITGHRALMVKPALTQAEAPARLDVLDVANFVTQAEVYRRTTDVSQTGMLIWENLHPDVYFAWWGQSCTPPCTVEVSTACFGVRNGEMGVIYPRPAQYDADASAFTALCPPQHRSPDRVIVNYKAGFPLQNGRVDQRLAKATALLAASLLTRKSCGCERANQYLMELRNLPIDDNGNLQASQTEIDRASRMFGMSKRGAVQAASMLAPDMGWQALKFG